MMVARALGWLYDLLLCLYPRGFRDAFAWEMRAVFENALAEAGHERRLAGCVVFWREVRDLPRAAVIAHFRERRRAMETRAGNTPEKPASWWATLAAISLFALPVTLTLTGSDMALYVRSFLLLGIMAFILLAFVLDAIRNKGLPRWSLPYGGLLMMILVVVGLFPAAEGQMTYLHGRVVRVGDELSRLAWQAIRSGLAWLFLLAALGMVVLALAALPPLRPTLAKVRRDWTRLSFLLYGAVVFVYVTDFDEYQHEGLYVAAGMLSLALGAWFYLRSKGTRQRILALLSGMTVAMWIMVAGKWLIVPRQEWPIWFGWHPPETERWFESLREVITWAWMMVALSAPALLRGRVEPNPPAPFPAREGGVAG